MSPGAIVTGTVPFGGTRRGRCSDVVTPSASPPSHASAPSAPDARCGSMLFRGGRSAPGSWRFRLHSRGARACACGAWRAGCVTVRRRRRVAARAGRWCAVCAHRPRGARAGALADVRHL
eukprot:5414516-Prymnesium_polylepis.1